MKGDPMHRWIATITMILAVSACGRLESCARSATVSTEPAEAAEAETAGRETAQETVERWVRMGREERIAELRRTLRHGSEGVPSRSLEADYDTCDAQTRAHPNYAKATPGQRYLYFMACMLKQGWKPVERP